RDVPTVTKLVEEYDKLAGQIDQVQGVCRQLSEIGSGEEVEIRSRFYKLSNRRYQSGLLADRGQRQRRATSSATTSDAGRIQRGRTRPSVAEGRRWRVVRSHVASGAVVPRCRVGARRSVRGRWIRGRLRRRSTAARWR